MSQFDITGDITIACFMRLVLDTDVVVAALRSPSGGSSEIIRLAADGDIQLIVSVPLVLEYEAVVKREEQRVAMGMSIEEADRRLMTLVSLCEPTALHFRWRPQLLDPADEMVLETAINGQADALVTFNLRHFGNVPADFGIEAATPANVLRRIRS